MKIFDKFEAVRFPEENLVFVTRDSFLYYIYYQKYEYWKKYSNAGNDSITVENYQDISKDELMRIMNGKFPTKETDFMRLCNPRQLKTGDMLALLEEDYSYYMNDRLIKNTVHNILLESNIAFKSYIEIDKVLKDNLLKYEQNNDVLAHIKELSLKIIGRDIFKKEIGIVDGHDPSSYFYIMPVRVIDYVDTEDYDNVAMMRSCEISIEEDDIDQYLTPFLYKYFDKNLEANMKRVDDFWVDDNEIEHMEYINDFDWYSNNYYTYESIKNILEDIKDTINDLSLGNDSEYTLKLKEKRGIETFKLIYAKNMSQDQIDEYNANRPTEDDTEINLIVDFYNRFIYRMEYMMKVGEENGYNLITFMGP